MAQDSDYEYDSDGGGAPAEASSSGRWLADHHKRRRWEAKEKELRAAMAQENTQKESKALGLAAAAGARAPRNVFSGAASFKVLAADLLALQHDAEDGASAGVRIEAEAVGDSVYHWSVRLSRFAAGSPAQKFLGLLERAHGYGHVELDVLDEATPSLMLPPDGAARTATVEVRGACSSLSDAPANTSTTS